MSFTCPRCGRTSQHPTDEAEGYCGACRAFTGAPLPPDPYAGRHLATKDPLEFIAACLERALGEEENGGDWLRSMMTDLPKFEGDKAALERTVDLPVWGVLLEQGRLAVQARCNELGITAPLRRL